MTATQPILKVVGRVTGRVRFWHLVDAFVRAGKWCLPPALVLFILDKLVDVPGVILALPGVAFVIAFTVLGAKALAGVNRFQVAKIIDDQMGLKDRLTSALYFEALKYTEGLAQAAIEEGVAHARHLDTRDISVGTWPRHSGRFIVAALLTLVVAVGPQNLASFFARSDSDTDAVRADRGDETNATAPAPAPTEETPLQKIEPKKPLTELTRLESDRPPERDPATMDTTMAQDLLEDIENIKHALSASELKDMEDAFKDDNKKGPAEEREEPPPRIAPLDKELLEDIARAEKKKVEKGEGKPEDAIGVAVKMPAPPGARPRGPRAKGGGGHGGGDVGESGDTRGPPKRIPIPGRDKLIIESRQSKDILEKTDLERTVMNELMMRLSMKDVKMTGTAKDVEARFTPQPRQPVVEEHVPLGLRGYVQRYFEGMGGRRTSEKPSEEPTDAAPSSE
ncbi:MAG TPA: hypothetical protein VMZ92_15680 [Planctomycetota bacterium]|nr:hypothetical protein [Planctomycetota bacterium]